MLEITAFCVATGDKLTLLKEQSNNRTETAFKGLVETTGRYHQSNQDDTLYMLDFFADNGDWVAGYNLSQATYSRVLQMIDMVVSKTEQVTEVVPMHSEAPTVQLNMVQAAKSQRAAKRTDVKPLTNDEHAASVNPAVLYLMGFQNDATRKANQTILKLLCRSISKSDDSDYTTFNWGDLRFQHVIAIKSMLQEKELSPSRVNSYLSVLKGVARHSRQLKLMSFDDYQSIIEVPSIKFDARYKTTYVTPYMRERVINHLTNIGTVKSIRDLAMFALLIGTGLRRSELVNLKAGQITASNPDFSVKGKGGKVRELAVPLWAMPLLTDWLDARITSDTDLTKEYMFLKVTKFDEICLTAKRSPLTGRVIARICEKLCNEVGVVKFTPHDLRGSFATHLLNQGVDTIFVSQSMGHSSADTLKHYDRRQDIERLEILRNVA